MKDFCRLRINLCLVFILFITGCSSLGIYNPATGRREFIAISTSQEVSMGQSVHQKIVKQYQLSEHQQRLRRVKRVGQRLAQVSDRQDYQYNFYLIEEDEMNAFTTPGGNIYIYTGLMDKLKTDGQIASVLAHEIGHCAARHTVKKYQAALGYNLIGSLILSQVEDQARKIASLSSNTVMGLVFSAYGRQDEYEADRLGVKYMQLAGYDLAAIIETLEILQEESKGPATPLILRSHPYLHDRINAVKREIQSMDARDALFEAQN
jgi:predicted Zn-dependent protease